MSDMTIVQAQLLLKLCSHGAHLRVCKSSIPFHVTLVYDHPELQGYREDRVRLSTFKLLRAWGWISETRGGTVARWHITAKGDTAVKLYYEKE